MAVLAGRPTGQPEPENPLTAGLERLPVAPTTLVIFGGTGDLAKRKLLPAIYNLAHEGALPERFHLIGVSRREKTHDEYRSECEQAIRRFSRRPPKDDVLHALLENVKYVPGSFDDDAVYAELTKLLGSFEQEAGEPLNRAFYLSTAPSFFPVIVEELGRSKLAHHEGAQVRAIIEKPFGTTLEEARELNRCVLGIFEENQVFRIDHYLGKETVQNILAFRFGNTLFEPVWNRRYIDHVQITVAEEEGVGHRSGYYERAGALRDIIQNHLLQILCLIAMEPPISFDSDEIRQKKVDVLRAIRRVDAEQAGQNAVRGQYGAGWIRGERVVAYHSEPGVAPDSLTETFAAVRFYVDNWRWQDVPFYLRTGKRLPARISEVCIHFRPVPHQAFPGAAFSDSRPNRLVMAIQPEEGILLRFEVKHPGPSLTLAPVMMQFYYREAFRSRSPEAYETLLLDIVRGDPTLFMRSDQTEAAWAVIDPILDMWQSVRPSDFPNYHSGSWGPEAADIFIARDGRSWTPPTFLQCREDLAMCRVAGEPLE